MDTLETTLAFAAVALASGTAGLLLGAMLTSSKVGSLYERLESAEAANRIQAELLDELAHALRLLLDDLARDTGAGRENGDGARQILERIALAAELRAHLDDPTPLSAQAS
jgi:hypothetical protein